ncbi:hypothetical protein HYFRA_00013980 [Hymenoscyphus fraxineus]|uniref:HET-domain-containing protein n=1 Tax=Hymenoscyphus fraxineus TaxID=746836 RepID=A0A9N9PPB6_9HELO|nr:hypothetical protein HYFRA_00013980 [Hymenoscyphus fraxineus]
MRLINARTLELKDFFEPIPKYTILSHTWGDEEVTFQEFSHDIDKLKAAQKEGFKKIVDCSNQTLRDGYEYCWVDTCCIDKTSSAELSEAINSMFKWYRDSERCYILLFDITVPDGEATRELLEKSRWFTRGWTLQELLAPSHRIFLDKDWKIIGKMRRESNGLFPLRYPYVNLKDSETRLANSISGITDIPTEALYSLESMEEYHISMKMSWAARRTTTRAEDMAYCLLGLFDISMPLLYGEGGQKAFIRLQEEILKQSVDRTIFAWEDTTGADTFQGLLAKSPAAFFGKGKLDDLEHNTNKKTVWNHLDMTIERYPIDADHRDLVSPVHFDKVSEHDSSVGITNRGIALQLPLIKVKGLKNEYLACLGCGSGVVHCCVLLSWLEVGSQYARFRPDKLLTIPCLMKHAVDALSEVFIQQKPMVPMHFDSHRVSTIVFSGTPTQFAEIISTTPGIRYHSETTSLEFDRILETDAEQNDKRTIQLAFPSLHRRHLQVWDDMILTIEICEAGYYQILDFNSEVFEIILTKLVSN